MGARYAKIAFATGPRWGSLQRSPDPEVGKWKAPGRERDRSEGKRKEGKGWEVEGIGDKGSERGGKGEGRGREEGW